VLASITGLIAAIAALVGALSGFIGMLVLIRRTSPRERRDAAVVAAEKVLVPVSPAVDVGTNLVELHKAQRGDSDEPGNEPGNAGRREGGS
jgi:hypothetical protein